MKNLNKEIEKVIWASCEKMFHHQIIAQTERQAWEHVENNFRIQNNELTRNQIYFPLRMNIIKFVVSKNKQRIFNI